MARKKKAVVEDYEVVILLSGTVMSKAFPEYGIVVDGGGRFVFRGMCSEFALEADSILNNMFIAGSHIPSATDTDIPKGVSYVPFSCAKAFNGVEGLPVVNSGTDVGDCEIRKIRSAWA